jgi:uncharacterized protein
MQSNEERCAEHAKFKRIDDAFRSGDLAALQAEFEDSSVIPNGPMPLTIGSCLEYAIYHSPLPFIRTLLEIGADPKPADHIGFPPLIAALSCSQLQPGAQARTDTIEVIRLLLQFGADPNQRGIEDYTALHMAVAVRNPAAMKLLLEAGGDPQLATRIDDCETPRAMAEAAGLREIASLLMEWEGRSAS